MFGHVKNWVAGGLTAAIVASSVLAIPSAAQAQSTSAEGSYQVAQNWNNNNNWQRRHHNGNWNNNNWRGGNRHYYNGRYYYRGPNGYYYNNNNYTGAAIAAGVIGLAAGAAIANSNQQRYVGNDYISYCQQRYRSFNPATGNYMGYDGRYHRCVMQ